MLSYNQINILLQKEDIEGYLEFGAPEDEYSSEAKEIAAALEELSEEERTEENILALLATIWANSFDLSREEVKKRLPALRRVVGKIIG